LKLFRIELRRPALNKKERDDPWTVPRRESFVVADGFDTATSLVVSHFNDLDGRDDYYVAGVDVVASTEEGEGDVLLAQLTLNAQ
jgi:hypothetical protein